MGKNVHPAVTGFLLSVITANLLGSGLAELGAMEFRKGFVFAFCGSASLASAIALLGRKHLTTWRVILPWYWLTVVLCSLGVLLVGCVLRVF